MPIEFYKLQKAAEKDTQALLREHTRASRSTSPKSDNLQIPAALLRESVESIHRELAERANARSEIAKLLEVEAETDMLIRKHLSNLRMAAIQNGTTTAKKPQFYSGPSVPEPAEDYYSPPQAVPLAATVSGQSGLGLWPQDQE